MNKLTLALAATAIAATASSTFVSTAEAGRRGGHRFHFGFHHFHHNHLFHRRHHVDEDYYERRRAYRKPRVIIKEVIKRVPTPVAVPRKAPVAPVKYEDGEGRQFDRTSKVWFDGKDQCWKGGKAFLFRSGSWFYGNARWVETSSGWGVSSGGLPQQVSCQGIQAFAGKIQQAEDKPATPAPVAKAAQAPAPAAQVAKAPEKPAPAPETSANERECKKYFPSVGEMVSVPCTE